MGGEVVPSFLIRDIVILKGLLINLIEMSMSVFIFIYIWEDGPSSSLYIK